MNNKSEIFVFLRVLLCRDELSCVAIYKWLIETKAADCSFALKNNFYGTGLNTIVVDGFYRFCCLVDLCQDCSNYSHKVRNGPASGDIHFHYVN
jgi:hypothetical protein